LQDKQQNIFFRAGILRACVTILRGRFPPAARELWARIVLIVMFGTNLYDVYMYGYRSPADGVERRRRWRWRG